MSQAISPSTKKPYGLALVCATWELARSTVYHHRQRRCEERPLLKRGPRTAWTDEQLVELIREALASSPWVGEGHRKAWARLRAQGVRTSKTRVLRLMREAGLLAQQRSQRVRGPQVHDGTIIPDRPDAMWGTDMTTTMTRLEGNASIFAVIDHATAECLGIHATKNGNRFEALEPLRQAVGERFGSYTGSVVTGLILRHDNGSVFTSDVYQDELSFLGIESSPSFVRQPEGNGCIERFFRTMKEQLTWLRTHDTIEQLRIALLEFKARYNSEWILERHGYLTPAAARMSYAQSRNKVA